MKLRNILVRLTIALPATIVLINRIIVTFFMR